jgi:hypothetical protein
MTSARVPTAAAALLLAILTLSPAAMASAPAAAAPAAGDPWEQIRYDEGPDAAGGEHVFLKFGDWDAAFGVAWGNSSSPGHIRLVAMQSRYLGLADAYDAQGNEVRRNIHVRIFTIHAARLMSILEFDDKNGNGIADFTRTGNDTTDLRESEPVFKGVNLGTAWTVTKRERKDDPANKSREFTLGLAAANLVYRSVRPVNGTLDLVEFTFHLKATMRQVDDATVPHFDLTVERVGERIHVTDAEYTGTVTASGKVGSYGVKWDHLIAGWDYAPANRKPGLVMEFQAIMANFVPPQVVEIGRALSQMTGDRSTWDTAAGEQSANEDAATDGWPDRLPSPMTTPRIHWMDRWARAGRLTWVTDVDVDGQPGRMYAQVQGARRVAERGPNGGLFYGIGILAGFSYPGGQRIYHDPTVESGAMIVDTTGKCEPPKCQTIGGIAQTARLPLGVILMVAVSAVLILSALMYAKHRGLGPFHYRYEEALDRREPRKLNDWDRAYDARRKD